MTNDNTPNAVGILEATRDPHETFRTITLGVIAVALVVIAAVLVGIAGTITTFVDSTGSAWTAPWVNTIEHGSWSVPEAGR